MIKKRMVAGNGAHPRHLICEISVRNLNGQKTGFTAMLSHDSVFPGHRNPAESRFKKSKKENYPWITIK